ncbi:hypothetical protein KCP75_15270 [Salmonella enterica subsp. enterica]|nr:hypothetical protein KCP75_15270 [Salmonella enterica subsp. enterica]
MAALAIHDRGGLYLARGTHHRALSAVCHGGLSPLAREHFRESPPEVTSPAGFYPAGARNTFIRHIRGAIWRFIPAGAGTPMSGRGDQYLKRFIPAGAGTPQRTPDKRNHHGHPRWRRDTAHNHEVATRRKAVYPLAREHPL